MHARNEGGKRSPRKDPVWVDRMLVALRRGKTLKNAVGVQAYFDYRSRPKRVEERTPWYEAGGILDTVDRERWLQDTVPANGDWRGLEHFFNGKYRSRIKRVTAPKEWRE